MTWNQQTKHPPRRRASGRRTSSPEFTGATMFNRARDFRIQESSLTNVNGNAVIINVNINISLSINLASIGHRIQTVIQHIILLFIGCLAQSDNIYGRGRGHKSTAVWLFRLQVKAEVEGLWALEIPRPQYKTPRASYGTRVGIATTPKTCRTFDATQSTFPCPFQNPCLVHLSSPHWQGDRLATGGLHRYVRYTRIYAEVAGTIQISTSRFAHITRNDTRNARIPRLKFLARIHPPFPLSKSKVSQPVGTFLCPACRIWFE